MRIFADEELDTRFAREGFVVVRLFDAERAAEIDALCRARLPAVMPQHENVTYIYAGQPELKWIDQLVGSLMDQTLMPLLVEMRRYYSSLIIKPAGEKIVPPHVHPIFTLEQSIPTVFCWCALEDTDESNGAMQVLRRSHKLFPIMPMYGREPYFVEAFDEVSERMETLYLRAGEALLFEESLIHGSLPNPGNRHRIALATHCIKQSLTQVTLFGASNGQLQVCDTGADFGYQYHLRPEPLDPTGKWPTLGYVDDLHRRVSRDEFWARMAEGKRISMTYPLVPRRTAPLDEQVPVTSHLGPSGTPSVGARVLRKVRALRSRMRARA